MVIKQLTQKYESPAKGGFSDTRLRFFILGFMSLGLIMAPFLGMIASFIVVLIFAIFTAVKINEIQRSNPVSRLLHLQAMDQMYHNDVNATHYRLALQKYGIAEIQIKKSSKRVAQYRTSVSNKNPLRLSLSRI